MSIDQKLNPTAAHHVAEHLRGELVNLHKELEKLEARPTGDSEDTEWLFPLRMKIQDFNTIAKYLDTQCFNYFSAITGVKELPKEETSDVCPKCSANPADGYGKFDMVVVSIRLWKDSDSLIRVIFDGPEVVEKKQNWNNIQWAMSALYKHAAETGNHYELRDTKIVRVNRTARIYAEGI